MFTNFILLSTYNRDVLRVIQEAGYGNYVLARWSGVKTYQRLYTDNGRTYAKEQSRIEIEGEARRGRPKGIARDPACRRVEDILDR